MKTLTSLLLASALVAAPIATSYAHQHTDKSDMPMMDSQMMKKMQTHMEEMQAVLDAVKSESDPEKREAMLHEHAQKMQDMMGMMEDMMGQMMGHTAEKAKPIHKHKKN